MKLPSFAPDVVHLVHDWSKYQLPGYYILSPPAPESGCWDEFGMEHCVVLNPIEKGGSLWIRRPEDIKAACHTLGAAQAALRLLQL